VDIELNDYVCLFSYYAFIGKTLIGCVWAKAFIKTFPGIKVYIIAPVSLKSEWKKTALNTTNLKCKDEIFKKRSSTKKKKAQKKSSKEGGEGRVASSNCNGDDNGVIHDNAADADVQPEGYDIEIFSWAKVPPAIPKSVNEYIVIADEGTQT
jgi:hypothetical protein